MSTGVRTDVTAPRIVRVQGIEISVPTAAGPVLAVRGLDLEVAQGETLAIVGESGCGKSLTALALAGLLPDGVHLASGRIELLGEDVTKLAESAWRARRGRHIAMVFQDPMAALNPVLPIGEQIVEAILAHRPVGRPRARDEALALLARVSLPDPMHAFAAYPHQLSGGMRQRVLIAVAIANQPNLLIADEPTTSLDATVQGEIFALLRNLQRDSGMALVIVTHDLNLVARWANRVIVMYAGRAVEVGRADTLLDASVHPYTQALMAARPHRRASEGARRRLAEIPGRVPAPGEAGAGCAFAGRCGLASAHCRSVVPVEQCLPHGAVWCHAVGDGGLGFRREAVA
ncbi:ABC transporter ATP-binding protein [Variovorax sp. J2P1-59]|uniref:ABC transporter ATP-binding protein n=1 Tax=Variovorax flavidus TaxID=3053501 RepID=UPI0025761314|nr:ABC transporter ATP-binding protein [Variovorax sp. J2P1-59]MDM0078119.1 ABC transporter ATP-binding protein [Variovorax sp. J2P1-59]